MLLKIASQDTYRIIMEFPSIFNAKLRLIWAETIFATAGCFGFKLCGTTHYILLIDFLQ